MQTLKPRAAAAIAVARPMPRLPPVMMATLSVKFAPTSTLQTTTLTGNDCVNRQSYSAHDVDIEPDIKAEKAHHSSSTSRDGSSKLSLTRTRDVTASLPSTTR